MKHILNDVFEKIYCINLIDRKDRKDLVNKSFNKIGLDVEFYDAIRYGFGTTCSNLIRNNSKGYFNLESNSEFGCFMSHYSILKNAKERGYKSILIIEDDICFRKDFNDIISEYFDKLPSDWDIISFYRVIYNLSDKNTKINDLWSTYYNSWSTMIYGLRSNGIEAILNYFDVFPCIADLPLYNNLENENIKFYSSNLPLCIPNKNINSDLRNQINELTNKNHMMRNINFDDYYMP